MNNPSSCRCPLVPPVVPLRAWRYQSLVAAVVAGAILSGCAGQPGAGHDRRQAGGGAPAVQDASSGSGSGTAHDGSRGAAAGGMTGQSGMTGPLDAADRRAMCDAHQRMLDAKTPDDRRAMMDEHMRNMPPDEFQRQMDMMQSQCR